MSVILALAAVIYLFSGGRWTVVLCAVILYACAKHHPAPAQPPHAPLPGPTGRTKPSENCKGQCIPPEPSIPTVSCGKCASPALGGCECKTKALLYRSGALIDDLAIDYTSAFTPSTPAAVNEALVEQFTFKSSPPVALKLRRKQPQ